MVLKKLGHPAAWARLRMPLVTGAGTVLYWGYR
jgi:hypothetical protein